MNTVIKLICIIAIAVVTYSWGYFTGANKWLPILYPIGVFILCVSSNILFLLD